MSNAVVAEIIAETDLIQTTTRMMKTMMTRLRIKKKSMSWKTTIDLFRQLYYMLIYKTISS